MKVLYVASDPETGTSDPATRSTLQAENEITELQRTSLSGQGKKIEFIFLPTLPFEELESQIWNFKPDIIHISAHGNKEILSFSNSRTEHVNLTAQALRTLLGPAPPKLVYLNACHSEFIAKEIVDTVEFAIGTDAPITNFAARKGAVAFYRAISQGRSLESAFVSSKSAVELLNPAKVTTNLFCNKAADATTTVLHEPTRIVAHFKEHKFTLTRGTAILDVGVAGCPDNTHQVVFCIDDRTSIKQGSCPEVDLCSVVLDTPWKGEIWCDKPWDIIGDCRVYATIICVNGDHYSVSENICDAVVNFYKIYFGAPQQEIPEKLGLALRSLRTSGGARLRPMTREPEMGQIDGSIARKQEAAIRNEKSK